jgi:hypothetical protein
MVIPCVGSGDYLLKQMKSLNSGEDFNQALLPYILEDENNGSSSQEQSIKSKQFGVPRRELLEVICECLCLFHKIFRGGGRDGVMFPLGHC